MRNIEITIIKKTLKDLIVKANFELPEDIKEAIGLFRKKERGSSVRQIVQAMDPHKILECL